MTKLKIGLSPLSNTIYIGSVSKKGLWGKDKTDVTDEAISVVAEHLFVEKQKINFTYAGKKYELLIREIGENI